MSTATLVLLSVGLSWAVVASAFLVFNYAAARDRRPAQEGDDA
jgi:hypothetical protein